MSFKTLDLNPPADGVSIASNAFPILSKAGKSVASSCGVHLM